MGIKIKRKKTSSQLSSLEIACYPLHRHHYNWLLPYTMKLSRQKIFAYAVVNRHSRKNLRGSFVLKIKTFVNFARERQVAHHPLSHDGGDTQREVVYRQLLHKICIYMYAQNRSGFFEVIEITEGSRISITKCCLCT